MIDKFTFLNDSSSWPIFLGAAVLIIVFVWKEWHQFSSTRFYLKALVILLAICSLVMIALKPAFFNSETSGNVILLTEGYRKSSLDSLKKEHKKIKIVDYEEDTPFIEKLKSVGTVFILGHGIKSYDLWQLEGKAATYIQGEELKGIIKFKYQPEHTIGDKAIFKGLYSRPTEGNRLILEGAGGQTLDSVKLGIGENQEFKLASDLKSAGNFVFSLVEKDSLGTILSFNPIPLKITKKDDLKILMFNGFPTFETKYLKNFLAEMDHEVIVKSQVTNGKYKYEFFNTENTTVGNISEKLLESYDLLIIDFNSYKTLSTSEKNALEKVVTEDGLGVFIQPEAALFSSNSGLARFDFSPDKNIEHSLKENISLKKYPFLFRLGLTVEPIQTSENKILSAFKRFGRGKVGTSVLENTYELLLSGYTYEYQQLWTKHINAMSKRAIPLAEWTSASKIGILDEPFYFQVRTLEEAPIALNDERSIIPLRRDIDLPDVWNGITFPKSVGWQHLSLQQDSTYVFDYYVTASKKWKTLRAYAQIQANKRNSGSLSNLSKKNSNPIPINPIYFYLVFLLSMGYLWLEPKMRSY